MKKSHNMSLGDLRIDEEFMRHIRLDLTPESLFLTRFGAKPEETDGFMFYLDLMDGPPSLMLMKTFNATSMTVGEVQGCPDELLLGATRVEGVKDVSGMYPVNREITDWIRTGLGLSP